ncbi:MAG TPA: class I SAM-dependent methyltransferase [Caulobacteraceae bacterium]
MPSQSNTTTNRYGSIATEIYDLDKPYGALPDTAFHLPRMAAVEGPILEPACGSGRTLVPLLEAGLDVSGFDTSPEMLARCEARCAAAGFSPDLSRQAFEDFHYERAFAAIIVPAGSFTLIADFAVALAVLRRFHDHLTAGGLLVLDIEPLSLLAASGEVHRTWTAANGDLLTMVGRSLKTDWLNQKAESLLRYERWRENVLVESQIEPMAQRHWSLQEFTLALQACGFGEIAVIGGYDRSRAPRPSDRVLTFEAVRI